MLVKVKVKVIVKGCVLYTLGMSYRFGLHLRARVTVVVTLEKFYYVRGGSNGCGIDALGLKLRKSWPLKEPFVGSSAESVVRLTSKSVEGTSLPLQGVDNIHGGDSLSLSVLSVGDGITDDVLEEDLEYSTSLLVDQAADSLHTTSPSQTPDGGLSDTLDVITEHLPVTLGATLSKTLSSFATSGHVAFERSKC